MVGGRHAYGCTCATHVDRPWNRSEHWTRAEIDDLEAHYGHQSDAAIARRLGRSIVGVRLKAKRLGLHKRDAGLSATAVAEIFGVDASTVIKNWIRRRLLRARRGYLQGPRRVHLVQDDAIWRFIAEHPECIDIAKMPDSPYRDEAARDPFISIVEAYRRTGRDRHQIAWLIRKGVIRGARRGQHWYMAKADLHLVPPLASPAAIAESVFRRDQVLQARRDIRKGLRRAPERRATRTRRTWVVRLLTRAEFDARWAREELAS